MQFARHLRHVCSVSLLRLLQPLEYLVRSHTTRDLSWGIVVRLIHHDLGLADGAHAQVRWGLKARPRRHSS
jgi:hypothetical protein